MFIQGIYNQRAWRPLPPYTGIINVFMHTNHHNGKSMEYGMFIFIRPNVYWHILDKKFTKVCSLLVLHYSL